VERTLHDLGDLVRERPRDVLLTYSQHYCCKCKSYFNVDLSDLAPSKSRYTYRVIAMAVRLVVEDGGKKGGATNQRRVPGSRAG
jgi:hypothetical protein